VRLRRAWTGPYLARTLRAAGAGPEHSSAIGGAAEARGPGPGGPQPRPPGLRGSPSDGPVLADRQPTVLRPAPFVKPNGAAASTPGGPPARVHG